MPVEYREAGAPPPSWFIDDLMRFLGQPYYVGLLSAAALHGAAHQQPQEFQVVTKKQLRSTTAGRGRIRFLRRLHLERAPTLKVKTETGTMQVSTREATALDLLRYVDTAGHLGNVATVVAALAETIDAKRIAKVAKTEDGLPTAQRLGHILDHVGAPEAASYLAAWVEERRPRFVPLRPDRSVKRARKDGRWRLLVNEKVDAET